MNIPIQAVPLAPAKAKTPVLPMHRFTVKQYHAMIEAGVLTEEDRCELVEGWIIDKMTHNPPHAGSVLATQTQLLSRMPDKWVVRIQSPISLGDAPSEAEPDVVAARGTVREYFARHPSPKDVGLVIEVADSTLEIDRELKSIAYARARLPVYWIINLVDSRIEVYTEPRAGKTPSYRRCHNYGADDSVPLVLDGREIARIPVRELLP